MVWHGCNETKFDLLDAAHAGDRVSEEEIGENLTIPGERNSCRGWWKSGATSRVCSRTAMVITSMDISARPTSEWRRCCVLAASCWWRRPSTGSMMATGRPSMTGRCTSCSCAMDISAGGSVRKARGWCCSPIRLRIVYRRRGACRKRRNCGARDGRGYALERAGERSSSSICRSARKFEQKSSLR